MTDNIIIPFISICAEARPTRRRNGVTFQQYVLGACCACPSASWNECSTAPVSMFAITAWKPLMRRPKLMPDAVHPGIWRVRWRDGRLSDMTNLTRAKDAVTCFIETEERRQRGRHMSSEGRLCATTGELGERHR